MQVHIPDPLYTSSERARANFRLAFRIALGFVALIWLIQLLNWGSGQRFHSPARRIRERRKSRGS